MISILNFEFVYDANTKLELWLDYLWNTHINKNWTKCRNNQDTSIQENND